MAGGAGDLFPLVSRVRGGDGRRQTVHIITCGCGREDLVAAHNTRLSYAHLRGTFQKRGWRVSDTGRHTCPVCIAETAADRRAALPRIEPAPTETDMKPAAPPPSPAASSAIVSLYVLLEDGYDRAAKAYKPGWSDERIAKDTGLSLEAVKARREADFGPLVVDTTLDQVRADWFALLVELEKVDRSFTATFGALKALNARHARISGLVETMAEKLGGGPDLLKQPPFRKA